MIRNPYNVIETQESQTNPANPVNNRLPPHHPQPLPQQEILTPLLPKTKTGTMTLKYFNSIATDFKASYLRWST